MAYESRLYIVAKSEVSNFIEIIARFDCGDMSQLNGWKELFKNRFSGMIYNDDNDTLLTEDCYGDPLLSTDFRAIINWLEVETVTEKKNPRLKPLLSLLKGFDSSEWLDKNIQIIHYGY